MNNPFAKLLPAAVTTLRGVGPERAGQLERLGCRTIGGLLLLRPRRHEDRRQTSRIGELETGQTAAVRGKIVELGLKKFRHGQRSVFEFVLEDGTGRLHCRWWNLPYMQNYFRAGEEWVVFGKVRSDRPLAMDHPETEPVENGEESSIHLGRIVPVYPLTEGLSQRWLRSLVWRALEEFGGQISDLRVEPKLEPSLAVAVGWLHFPERLEEPELARRRLALEEFLEMHIGLRARRQQLEAHAQARPCPGTNALVRPFLRALGFSLTSSQRAVLRDIRLELSEGRPMRRLLQGDVGSGKTVVAACSALMVLECGYNVALMAPTEILAEQHFLTFRRWFEPLGIEVFLQTGSRRTDRGGAGAPASLMAIGTHALIQEKVSIENLGLVLIDEQHKFGVAQREKLVRKGRYPHLLVLTATPIPRTLGLTVYGDLEVSILRELPAGRQPVKTYVRTPAQLPKVWDFVRGQIDKGRQAYVVYPRVEETEEPDLKAVTAEFERLRAWFAPKTVGLLHGRMSFEEKSAAMEKFRRGQCRLLVSTQVIEVGLDVPNATIMVVENAEQFGLAQLHQLRGRIGRGPDPSHCILIESAKTGQARQRLAILEKTADGFRIAEEDLKLRGPGDLLGWEQSGLPPLRFGDLARDFDLIQAARDLANRQSKAKREGAA